MRVLKAACPQCHKRFEIELPPQESQLFSVVACDHCGYERRVGVFVKEVQKQDRAQVKEREREADALAVLAKNAEERRAREEFDRQLQQETEQQLAVQHEQERIAQQEAEDDWKRLNTGVGCPRCGSIRTKEVTKISVAGWIMFWFGMFLIFWCVGVFLIVIGLNMRESRLQCQKCGLVRSA